MGEGGGNDDAAKTEEHDEMTADDKRVMEPQYGALRLWRPPLQRTPVGRHPLYTASHLEIGTVESDGDIRGVDEKDDEGPICQNSPIYHQANSEDGEVAGNDVARQVVRAHQGDMTPAEKHAPTMEIAHGECRGRLRPRDTPTEIGMKEETDTEDGIVKGHQQT